eukprot:760528-Hanusia_phi.AAC.3
MLERHLEPSEMTSTRFIQKLSPAFPLPKCVRCAFARSARNFDNLVVVLANIYWAKWRGELGALEILGGEKTGGRTRRRKGAKGLTQRGRTKAREMEDEKG